MPTDIPVRDFEPEWLWRTRVTAEAARVAMVKGRTAQERCEIYERLILAAFKERQHRKSPEHGGSIAEATASVSGNLLYNHLEVEEGIIMSGFEAPDTRC